MGSDPPSASGRDPAAELASISSLQSSLAEYAGGVATEAAVGALRARKKGKAKSGGMGEKSSGHGRLHRMFGGAGKAVQALGRSTTGEKLAARKTAGTRFDDGPSGRGTGAYGPCEWLHGSCRNAVETRLCTNA